MFHITRIAFARNQQGDRDIGVVLPEFDRAAAVVEHSALVLAQTIESLPQKSGENHLQRETYFPHSIRTGS